MTRYSVVVTETIHPDGIDLLRKECEVIELSSGSDETLLLSYAEKADALLTRGGIKVKRPFMEASYKLKVIAVHGVGADHVDLDTAADLGIVVFNTPTALTETVAELTVALLLALIRRVVSADKAVRAGEWSRKYSDLIGSELMGKTVGIIGLGRIGTAVARRLKGFDVNLLYYDVTRKREVEDELNTQHTELNNLLSTSDIITLHMPLTSETHHLISHREFNMMKKGAYLINMARGKIIDENALIEALRSGKLAGAALDVFEEEPPKADNPLLSFDNVVLTPHIGASSREAMRRMAIQSAEGILKVFRGETPPNIVKA